MQARSFSHFSLCAGGRGSCARKVTALTDAISFTLGLRYTDEDKKLDANIATTNPGCSRALAIFGRSLNGVPAVLQGVACVPNVDPRYDGAYTTSRSESNWSGTSAINARLDENFSTFVSYARGYKGGGYQLDRSGMNAVTSNAAQLAYNPEKADSYETGVKSVFLDGMAHANLSAFYTRFDDYQFSFFTGTNRRTANVKSLSTKGFELETSYRPMEELRLDAALTYQEAIFCSSGFPVGLTQLQGSTAPIAPRFIAVGAVSYETPVSGTLKLVGGVDARWQSPSNVGASATPTPAFRQKAYTVAGARLGVQPIAGAWKLEAWGRNIFDQHAWSILNSTTLQPGSISGYVIDPRSYGLTASYTW